MRREKIIERCLKLGMSQEEAEWVADNYERYYVPDWSEWTNRQINGMLRDTRLQLKIYGS